MVIGSLRRGINALMQSRKMRVISDECRLHETRYPWHIVLNYPEAGQQIYLYLKLLFYRNS